MKTVQDYMNDPRILNDAGLMAAPEEIREVHAIRLKHHDETDGMTAAAEADYYARKAAALFAGTGKVLEFVSFAGQGKLKPRAASIAGV
ncbi:hypothetical protein AGMMS49944_05260 [Spirochaetia bacterium]|nr:hypothetical protein AGMMS49944_05260 [Spirochaetia bacterium]